MSGDDRYRLDLPPSATDLGVTAAQYATLVRWADSLPFASWVTWTPVLTATTTAPTLSTDGSHIATGGYLLLPEEVRGYFRFRFGTVGAAAGNGAYRVVLPAEAAEASMSIGGGTVFDSSGADLRSVSLETSNAPATTTPTHAIIRFTAVANSTVNNAQPWIWASSDEIRGSFSYRRIKPSILR
jgi:hypothetical protein